MDKIRNKGGTVVVCGVLLWRGVGAEWLCRAVVMNCWVANHCKSNGWAFIENWGLFYGKDNLYAQDGVQLPRQSARVWAGTLGRDVKAINAFFISQRERDCTDDREDKIVKLKNVISLAKAGNSLSVHYTYYRSI